MGDPVPSVLEFLVDHMADFVELSRSLAGGRVIFDGVANAVKRRVEVSPSFARFHRKFSVPVRALLENEFIDFNKIAVVFLRLGYYFSRCQ